MDTPTQIAISEARPNTCFHRRRHHLRQAFSRHLYSFARRVIACTTRFNTDCHHQADYEMAISTNPDKVLDVRILEKEPVITVANIVKGCRIKDYMRRGHQANFVCQKCRRQRVSQVTCSKACAAGPSNIAILVPAVLSVAKWLADDAKGGRDDSSSV